MTIDTDAKTVTVTLPLSATYPAQITDNAVTWYSGGAGNNTYRNTYNRQTGQLDGELTYGNAPLPCVRVPKPW